jgi:hypothetical protein
MFTGYFGDKEKKTYNDGNYGKFLDDFPRNKSIFVNEAMLPCLAKLLLSTAALLVVTVSRKREMPMSSFWSLYKDGKEVIHGTGGAALFDSIQGCSRVVTLAHDGTNHFRMYESPGLEEKHGEGEGGNISVYLVVGIYIYKFIYIDI